MREDGRPARDETRQKHARVGGKTKNPPTLTQASTTPARQENKPQTLHAPPPLLLRQLETLDEPTPPPTNTTCECDEETVGGRDARTQAPSCDARNN